MRRSAARLLSRRPGQQRASLHCSAARAPPQGVGCQRQSGWAQQPERLGRGKRAAQGRPDARRAPEGILGAGLQAGHLDLHVAAHLQRLPGAQRRVGQHRAVLQLPEEGVGKLQGSTAGRRGQRRGRRVGCRLPQGGASSRLPLRHACAGPQTASGMAARQPSLHPSTRPPAPWALHPPTTPPAHLATQEVAEARGLAAVHVQRNGGVAAGAVRARAGGTAGVGWLEGREVGGSVGVQRRRPARRRCRCGPGEGEVVEGTAGGAEQAEREVGQGVEGQVQPPQGWRALARTHAAAHLWAVREGRASCCSQRASRCSRSRRARFSCSYCRGRTGE